MPKSAKPPATAPSPTEPYEGAALDMAKRIMKRLAQTPYEPHKPLGKRPPKAKERPASKGGVHKGRTRN